MKTENEDWYWEVIIKVAEYDLDLVTFYLFENDATGIEEICVRDKMIINRVYFPPTVQNPIAIIEKLQAGLQLSVDRLEYESHEQKNARNWQENWKSHFKPLKIGKNFVVRPSWEESESDRLEIVIHPGQGFGTGYHESTKLALELLERCFDAYQPERVIDVGAGSGILTIGALLLGAGYVSAVDIDRCVEAEIPNNISLSGLTAENWAVRCCDAGDLEEKGDLVMANIEDHILVNLMNRLVSLVERKGLLLLSGILIENRDELLGRLPDSFETLTEKTDKEWYCALFQRRA